MPRARADLRPPAKLMVRPGEAAAALSMGDDAFLATCREYGIAPVVQRHRLTLYDWRDLETLRDRMRERAGLVKL